MRQEIPPTEDHNTLCRICPPVWGDAWETSRWGFSQISLHHGTNGRKPCFSGLTEVLAVFAVTSAKGKERKERRSESQPTMPVGMQKALGHCGDKATEGGKATELPDSHLHRKMRINGPTPVPPTPAPSTNTIITEKRKEKPCVCQRSKTNKRCLFGHT